MSHAIELEKVTKRFGNCLAVDQPRSGRARGGDLRIHRSERLGQDHHAAHDPADSVSRRRANRRAGMRRGAAADDRVGYLPEERGLYRKMRVRELLRFFAQLKGMRHCRAGDRRLAGAFRAGPLGRTSKVETLSKGMSQKVQFIAAVVARPRLLVLDEPFTGLDPVNMDVLRDAVRSAHQNGTTVIFSTHDMDVAERLCDTIFMIFRGKKVLDGTLAAIQAQFGEDTIRLRTADADVPRWPICRA